MPYASAQDLKERYPEKDLRELSDVDAVVINDDVLDRALADASDEMDGYLNGRYTLPMAQAPRVLTLYACDIAMYRLQSLRPQAVTEDAEKRYKSAIAYMTKVSRGDVQLGVSALEQPAVQEDGPLVIVGDRRFTRDAMRGL